MLEGGSVVLVSFGFRTFMVITFLQRSFIGLKALIRTGRPGSSQKGQACDGGPRSQGLAHAVFRTTKA